MAKVAPGIPGATFAISGVITAPSAGFVSQSVARRAARAAAYHGAISTLHFGPELRRKNLARNLRGSSVSCPQTLKKAYTERIFRIRRSCRNAQVYRDAPGASQGTSHMEVD